MILYAPIIDPVVPAFVGNNMIINFEHNIAVHWNEPQKFYIRICDYLTNTEIETITYAILDPNEMRMILERGQIIVELEKTYTEGNFYKVQMAYIDTAGMIGPMSAVGITRFLGSINDVTFGVLGLTDGSTINKHRITYQGTYSYQASGLTENIYQYRFQILTEAGNTIIEDSEWLIPKRVNNNIDMSYTFENELEYFQKYNLCFSIKTVNGYEDSKTYLITKVGLYPTALQATLVATQSPQAKENGYVEIYFQKGGIPVTGTFRLIRQGYGEHHWEELTTCKMDANDSLDNFFWRDYSVEHGQYYTYGFQQYGVGTDDLIRYSTPILATIKEVEFEYMYLGDDQYQLKIAFNPQVNSFKETVLENKVDVIGGKYPVFFRNGNVRYSEIPISGLLSYFLDDDGYFLPVNDLYPGAFDLQGNFKRTTHLTNYNFASERQFKMAVLNWLNNGKPKLFRSPAEGNYVLRLMNVNISPNTQVGRMLHTFSATGYEVMPASPKAMLNAYNPVLSFNVINSKYNKDNDNFGVTASDANKVLITGQTQTLNLSADTTVIALSLHGNDSGGTFELTYNNAPLRLITIGPNDTQYFSLSDLHQLQKISCQDSGISYDIYYLGGTIV